MMMMMMRSSFVPKRLISSEGRCVFFTDISTLVQLQDLLHDACTKLVTACYKQSYFWTESNDSFEVGADKEVVRKAYMKTFRELNVFRSDLSHVSLKPWCIQCL